MKKTITLLALMLLLIAAKAQPVIENGVLISWRNATGDVVIPENVTEISFGAFPRSSITSVTIPASVKKIRGNPFFYCLQLKKFVVASNSAYFSSENDLLFNKDQSELICYPIAKTGDTYAIPNTVKTLKTNCFFLSELETITIPNSVIKIESLAFQSCKKLKKLSIPASVTSVDVGVFSNSRSLAEINVEGANANYSSQNGVLFNKDKTTLLAYPEGKSEASYSIPSSVNIIGDNSFRFSRLVSITIPNSVTKIGNDSFNFCILLTDISVDANSAYYSSENGILFNKDKTALVKYPRGKKNESYTIPSTVNTIKNGCFYETQQKNIVIPNSVTTIESYAFFNCPNLTSLNIPGSATNISEMFITSSDITGLKFGNGITTFSLQTIRLCYNLTTIDLSEVTSIKTFNITGIEYNAKASQTFYVANEEIKAQFTKAGLKAIVGTPLQFKNFTNTLNGTSVTLSIAPESAMGNINVTEKGFVVSQSHIPTLDANNYKIPVSGNALLPFTGSVNGLQPNIVYHARAYVAYDNVTAYSDNITFVLQQANGAVFPPTLNINEANIKVGGYVGLIVQGDTQKVFEKAKWEVNGKALPADALYWRVENTGIFILKATSADGKSTIEKKIEIK